VSDTVIEAGDGDLTYIDMGSYWIEVDNRGAFQTQRHLPKSLRSIGVDPSVRQELEARIENANTDVAEDELFKSVSVDEYLPPAETTEDRQKREEEAASALEQAGEQQKAETDEAQAEARSKQPKPTAGSASKKE
jgi:hypothetical protein